MKLFTKRNLVLLALMACLFTIASMPLAAQTSTRVMRTTYQGETHVGRCCKLWDATVNVTEPQDKLVPIVITFSMDYRATAPMYIGLRVNDGVCAFNGPNSVETFSPANETQYKAATYQWIVMPGDYKLAKGPNKLQVCGGGIDFFAENDTITLGFNTLSADLVK